MNLNHIQYCAAKVVTRTSELGYHLKSFSTNSQISSKNRNPIQWQKIYFTISGCRTMMVIIPTVYLVGQLKVFFNLTLSFMDQEIDAVTSVNELNLLQLRKKKVCNSSRKVGRNLCSTHSGGIIELNVQRDLH